MEHPIANWNDFSSNIIQKDVFFQVTSNFLNDEEQTNIGLARLGPEGKKSSNRVTKKSNQHCGRYFQTGLPKRKGKTKN